MADGTPVLLRSAPGIKRDGTEFEGENYIDGKWCRFQRGLPRKIGGYRSITQSLTEKIYGMESYTTGGINYLHLGSASLLEQVRVSSSGGLAGQSNRTPVGFVANAANLWQFEVFNNSVSATDTQLIAHAGHNLSDISATDETQIFAGSMTSGAALTDTGMDPQSGGVLVLSPYLITFGNGGRVDVSAVNDFSGTAGTAFVTGQKVVRGLPLRSSGGPAGLLWSLDSLIQMTFNPSLTGPIPFDFNTITSEISILSSQAVIEYNGIYYWPGVDCWYMFNGVVREIPNPFNTNYFFDGLNFSQRQKVFAYKVPRFGEIWWCYPRGTATECTHAVIFNVREGYWYDTPLPDGGRSAGVYAKVYSKPFMIDVDLTATGYSLLQHETGVNSVMGTSNIAIQSYFETSDFTNLIGDRPSNKNLRLSFVESDFVQSGDLNITVKGRANARAAVEDLRTVVVPEVATTPNEQITPFKDSIRLLRFKFESNVVNGDYQMGQCLAHLEPSEARMTK